MSDNPYRAEEGEGAKPWRWSVGCLIAIGSVCLAILTSVVLVALRPYFGGTTPMAIVYLLIVGMTIAFYGGILVGIISGIGWFIQSWRKRRTHT